MTPRFGLAVALACVVGPAAYLGVAPRAEAPEPAAHHFAESRAPLEQDSARPWHVGVIHKGCTRDGTSRDDHESDAQVAEWHVCTCRHGCDRSNEETGGRKWDPKCQARCSPTHCHCPHPCSQTE